MQVYDQSVTQMNRRSLLKSAAAGLAVQGFSSSAPRKWRVCVIGHTGRGDYGHGIDLVWKSIPGAEVLAVADPVAEGAAKAAKRTGAARIYADYREMLRKEKPDLVSICPRWADQRVEMIEAVAGAGAHIFMEKPMARNLADADRIVAAAARNRVKVQLAHVMHASPYVRHAARMVENGDIGTLFELRGRGKEDSRAGGEDLMTLGTHIMDLFRLFAGNPTSCHAHVTQDGADVDPSHARTPTEPVGVVAGNQVNATFAFPRGVHAHFSSMASPDPGGARFGIHIYGSRGVIFVPIQIFPSGQPSILRSAGWMPTAQRNWEPVTLPDPVPPPSPLGGQHLSNVAMVEDLLEAIQTGREPMCSEVDGRWTIEMVTAVYQSHLSGRRVPFPLRDRRSGLE
jgi:predicted dehydrogenase